MVIEDGEDIGENDAACIAQDRKDIDVIKNLQIELEGKLHEEEGEEIIRNESQDRADEGNAWDDMQSAQEGLAVGDADQIEGTDQCAKRGKRDANHHLDEIDTNVFELDANGGDYDPKTIREGFDIGDETCKQIDKGGCQNEEQRNETAYLKGVIRTGWAAFFQQVNIKHGLILWLFDKLRKFFIANPKSIFHFFFLFKNHSFRYKTLQNPHFYINF